MTQQFPARNMLKDESSPYLVQHADNPVHWRPWSESAFEEARQSNKPVLVSIGYAACHWCHVMAHESFENPDIAKLMNELFVNIKVDREERPDIDQIYMNALHAMGEQGGWPLTIFIDPDGRPFWGGTYFPPVQKYGRAGFPDILRAISKAWRDERSRIDVNGVALGRYLDAQAAPPENPSQPDISQFTAFSDAVLNIQDPVHGGTKGAPKFPNTALSETLARAASGDNTSIPAKAFLKLMDRMSVGGIYDHVGGGLSRYSVDEYWLVPHFEKMLYDNAHYLRHLGWAYKISPNNLFRARIEQTIDWLNREMLLSGGAYASSLDADSEGEEGKYYVWSPNEVSEILRSKSPNFLSAYDITPTGNFEGSNIPNLLRFTDLNEAESIRKIFSPEIQKLLEVRLNRKPPARDDKILTDWNGYLIRALAELGFQFENKAWIDLAIVAFHYITESISTDAYLPHSFRNETAVRPAMATDYASMINAAITLAEVSADPNYLKHARNWFGILETDYNDSSGGFYLTSIKSDALLLRPRCDLDEAIPSGASQILEAYIRFSALSSEQDYSTKAWNLAANLNSAVGKSGHGAAGFFNAIHSLFNHRHVKIYAENDNAAQPFLSAIRECTNPALSFEIIQDIKPTKYMGFEILPPKQLPSAIICNNQSCSQPITATGEFKYKLTQ